MSTSLVSLAALVDAFNPVTPQLRVAAIIAQHGRILLLEHHKRGQRYWVLPGGRLQGNETLDAALRRELREELGLEARVGRLAYGSAPTTPDSVVVTPGDTLWSIASARYRGDPRPHVEAILEANHLTSPMLTPGQALLIPRE